VAALGDEALFLDSAGTVTVMNLKTGEAVFTFSSVGSLDAAFLDRGNLIVGRSAVSGNSPFLMVNTATGETVPLAYSSAIGARVYRGRGGMVYGAVIDQGLEGAVTALIRIDTVNAALSERLVEYQGEDTLVDLAESGGVLASTVGGDGATLYKSPGVYSFERGPGLPLRLIDGDFCFVVLDGEGNIAWHDPDTGKLLALFRIYGDRWIMETRGPLREGPVIRGATGAFNG
jgi:hypothetical protein